MRIKVALLVLLAAIIVIASYNGNTYQENNDNDDSVIEVTQLAQINASLQEGPVLLKIGAKWCGPCQAMKPVLKGLANEYAGKATIMSIDVDKSPDLANFFVVNAVPDSSMIVGIKNNEYVYMREDGKTSNNRFESRILGFREKQELEKILRFSLQKENEKSSTGNV